MKESSEKRERRIMTGMHRKAGGIGKIPAEFLPSGRMKVIRSTPMPKVVVTEEDKRIREKLWKAESRLDRILGKIKMGLEVTELEKKRVPFLKATIKGLKSKLFSSSLLRNESKNKSPSGTNIPEKE